MVAGNAVARRRARVEPSAPATTSSTPASSRRHLSGARHTRHKHVHQVKEGALREEGVGTTCRRAGNGSAGRTHQGAEPRRGVALRRFLGVDEMVPCETLSDVFPSL
jgi:hypothetical protein